MKEQRRGNGLRTVGTFALGAAVGSIISLLYAPASGEATRRRLANKVRNLRRTAIRQLEQTGRVLATRASDVREAAGEWLADRMPFGNGKHPIRRRPVRHAHAN